MDRTLSALLALALLAGPAGAQAPQARGIDVGALHEIAEGTGSSPEAALRDALHRAVQQAIGVYVEARELLKVDGKLVEEISTYSNGYVEKHTQLKSSSTGNVHKVRVMAIVRKGPLLVRLKKEKVPLKPGADTAAIDGASPAWKVLTAREQRAKALALVTRLLAVAPKRPSYLKVSLKAKPSDPVVRHPDQKDFTYWPVAALGYDWASVTAYGKWLADTLQTAGVAQKVVLSYRHASVPDPDSVRWTETFTQPAPPSIFHAVPHGSELNRYVNWLKGRGEVALAILTSSDRDGASLRTTWAVFTLERKLLTEALKLSAAARRDDSSIEAVAFDGEGKVVRRADAGHLAPGLISDHNEFVYVGPFRFWEYGDARMQLQTRASASLTLSLEELKRVRSIQVRLRKPSGK